MSLALDIARRRRAAGFGFGPDEIWNEGGDPTYIDPDDIFGGGGGGGGNSGGGGGGGGNSGGSGSPPWWYTSVPLFSVIGRTVSSIFGNQYQEQPTQTSYRQGQTLPPGYGFDSNGRLVQQSFSNVGSFITNNPLLVGGVVLGVVLLFRTPPGRR